MDCSIPFEHRKSLTPRYPPDGYVEAARDLDLRRIAHSSLTATDPKAATLFERLPASFCRSRSSWPCMRERDLDAEPLMMQEIDDPIDRPLHRGGSCFEAKPSRYDDRGMHDAGCFDYAGRGCRWSEFVRECLSHA